jgi:hypothetical protein
MQQVLRSRLELHDRLILSLSTRVTLALQAAPPQPPARPAPRPAPPPGPAAAQPGPAAAPAAPALVAALLEAAGALQLDATTLLPLLAVAQQGAAAPVPALHSQPLALSLPLLPRQERAPQAQFFKGEQG